MVFISPVPLLNGMERTSIIPRSWQGRMVWSASSANPPVRRRGPLGRAGKPWNPRLPYSYRPDRAADLSGCLLSGVLPHLCTSGRRYYSHDVQRMPRQGKPSASGPLRNDGRCFMYGKCAVQPRFAACCDAVGECNGTRFAGAKHGCRPVVHRLPVQQAMKRKLSYMLTLTWLIAAGSTSTRQTAVWPTAGSMCTVRTRLSSEKYH